MSIRQWRSTSEERFFCVRMNFAGQGVGADGPKAGRTESGPFLGQADAETVVHSQLRDDFDHPWYCADVGAGDNPVFSRSVVGAIFFGYPVDTAVDAPTF